MTVSDLDKARADQLVPDFAKDNYDQMARDIAKNEDISPKEGMARLVAGWRQQHELKPLDGYDHLANWGDGRDPGTGTDDLAAKAATVNRAVESAKREPSAYLAGTDEVTAAATAAVEQATAADDVEDPEELNSGPAKDAKPARKTAASSK